VKNADKVDQAIDKGGDVVDDKTQAKYKDAVDKVQDAAKGAVDEPDEAGNPRRRECGQRAGRIVQRRSQTRSPPGQQLLG
jgi:hypothetical protein